MCGMLPGSNTATICPCSAVSSASAEALAACAASSVACISPRVERHQASVESPITIAASVISQCGSRKTASASPGA